MLSFPSLVLRVLVLKFLALVPTVPILLVLGVLALTLGFPVLHLLIQTDWTLGFLRRYLLSPALLIPAHFQAYSFLEYPALVLLPRSLICRTRLVHLVWQVRHSSLPKALSLFLYLTLVFPSWVLLALALTHC